MAPVRDSSACLFQALDSSREILSAHRVTGHALEARQGVRFQRGRRSLFVRGDEGVQCYYHVILQ